MYLADTLRVFVRRWLFFGFGLAVSVGAGVATLDRVSSDYQASGQLVVLLPPDAQGTQAPVNPYLNLQSGLSMLASIVATDVMSATTERELASAGFTAEYDVGLLPGVGPLLQVTAKSKDPAMALATRDAVMTEVSDALTELQRDRGIPSRQIISAQESNVSPTAQVLPGSRLRALVGAVGSCLLLLLVATFALDRALARSKPKNSAQLPMSPDTGDSLRPGDTGVGGPEQGRLQLDRSDRDRVLVG